MVSSQVSHRSATFRVEEPSSCSKRWSEWAFVVLCEYPELQISIPAASVQSGPCLVLGELVLAFDPVTCMNLLDLVHPDLRLNISGDCERKEIIMNHVDGIRYTG
ncbi:hypothetical protein F2Q70_00002484 [Brassica cretica]|uniref:Uncharacterized protein n=1 Tax=Brassica cretica TaxID=69181 RepID=A0A8S9IS01_BRACR|nr:hypothetical protein F2Q70_00002484 [Brassica cretica]